MRRTFINTTVLTLALATLTLTGCGQGNKKGQVFTVRGVGAKTTNPSQITGSKVEGVTNSGTAISTGNSADATSTPAVQGLSFDALHGQVTGALNAGQMITIDQLESGTYSLNDILSSLTVTKAGNQFIVTQERTVQRDANNKGTVSNAVSKRAGTQLNYTDGGLGLVIDDSFQLDIQNAQQPLSNDQVEKLTNRVFSADSAETKIETAQSGSIGVIAAILSKSADANGGYQYSEQDENIHVYLFRSDDKKTLTVNIESIDSDGEATRNIILTYQIVPAAVTSDDQNAASTDGTSTSSDDQTITGTVSSDTTTTTPAAVAN